MNRRAVSVEGSAKEKKPVFDWKTLQPSQDLKTTLSGKERHVLAAQKFNALLLNCCKNHDMKAKKRPESDESAKEHDDHDALVNPAPAAKGNLLTAGRHPPMARFRTGLHVHCSRTITDIIGSTATVQDLMVNSQKIRYAFFRKRFCSISYALAKKLRQRKGLLEWLEEARKHAISLDRLRIRFDPLELPFTGLN